MKISRVFCDNYPLKRTLTRYTLHAQETYTRTRTRGDLQTESAYAEGENCTETGNITEVDATTTLHLNIATVFFFFKYIPIFLFSVNVRGVSSR